MFWIKNKTIRYTPANPSFFYIKVGYEGVYITQTCFRDVTVHASHVVWPEYCVYQQSFILFFFFSFFFFYFIKRVINYQHYVHKGYQTINESILL